MFILTPNIITPQHLLLVAALMLYTGIEHLSLMTYGWAILIIAVVLGALFQLGIFNANNFAPKEQPGACQVVRTSEAGGTVVASLEGLCNGQLPEYVTQLNGNAYINVPAYVPPDGITNAFSVFAWVYVPVAPGGDTHGGVVAQRCSSYCTWFVELYNNGAGRASPSFYYNGATYSWNQYAAATSFPLSTWQFVGFVVQGSTIYAYSDSVQYPVAASYATNSLYLQQTWIGTRGDGICGSCIVGSIANVQVYNTSLSQAEVNALYSEGIGGAPVKPQNLVGWWPLNGNANDYSGNNNNGAATNVIYTGTWTNQYTGPV